MSRTTECEELRRGIIAVLRRYYQADDRGNLNPEYAETFSAADAITAIHELVGSIDNTKEE